MFHYLFTNDLRITTLESSLKQAGSCFINNKVPSASENKSVNNNIMTLGFYFDLTEKSNCSVSASNSNIRSVVLNFIKKFQYPNLRTKESYNQSITDGIKLVPMRLIVKLLFIMQLSESKNSFLTKDEILNFIFYNESVAKVKNPDIIELYNEIKLYRKKGIMPKSIIKEKDKRNWKQEDRQVREMIKILNWSGYISENENGICIKYNELEKIHKAEIFDIINAVEFWDGGEIESYRKYMDLEKISDITEDSQIEIKESEGYFEESGYNLLFYGVPGSGKSYQVNEYIQDQSKMERVVFHPDYTYSDFVGQILPIIDNEGKICYKFTSGPFTSILKKAKNNSKEIYYLVIEEINRGNAPAIFGEIFQLLDRDEYGNSKYTITSPEISKVIYDNDDMHISLPSNLNIIATMNTSDQNVFTLDTAFQRRWRMRLIQNDIDSAVHAEKEILDTKVKWKDFCKIINRQILESNNTITSSEDKRLGAYFIEGRDLLFDEREDKGANKIDRIKGELRNSLFSEKVIKYLWDDAFKFSRESLFNNDFDSLEAIINAFNNARSIDRWRIFNKDIVDQLLSNSESV